MTSLSRLFLCVLLFTLCISFYWQDRYDTKLYVIKTTFRWKLTFFPSFSFYNAVSKTAWYCFYWIHSHCIIGIACFRIMLICFCSQNWLHHQFITSIFIKEKKFHKPTNPKIIIAQSQNSKKRKKNYCTVDQIGCTRIAVYFARNVSLHLICIRCSSIGMLSTRCGNQFSRIFWSQILPRMAKKNQKKKLWCWQRPKKIFFCCCSILHSCFVKLNAFWQRDFTHLTTWRGNTEFY